MVKHGSVFRMTPESIKIKKGSSTNLTV